MLESQSVSPRNSARAWTTKRKLNICHVVSEVDPFSRSGGLASVAAALPKAHRELGHKVTIITPFYSRVTNAEERNLTLLSDEVMVGLTREASTTASFWQGTLPHNGHSVPVYLIGHDEFFGEVENGPNLYRGTNKNLRYLFFNAAALALLRQLETPPDIIHCHDWHTGLIPYFLRGRFKHEEFWRHTATVFTIHNLSYQFGRDWWEVPPDERDDGRSALPEISDEKGLERINFAKRAILNADAINTVSETYREEILTKDFGEDLHRILKNREERVFGIVNGIDYEEYNPLTDPGLFQHYSDQSPERKRANKKWLQEYFNLKVNDDIPILCSTSRLSEQKGYLLLLEILPTLLRQNLQLIIMADGDKKIADQLLMFMKKHPKKMAVVPFEEHRERETSVYAGSDIFLLPSRFEPCGLNQLIALRYGCIPIVHHIGGLADTIVDFEPETGRGNGFNFKRYEPADFLMAVTRALETYRHKTVWRELMVSCLQEANSWKIPARKYVDLYRVALKFHHVDLG